MNNIFSYYTKYREHIDEYKQWSDKQLSTPATTLSQSNELKQKAKAIAEPILLLDSYTHEKAEDSETFYQTYNTELMSVTSLLCLLPMTITKAIPFLNKHADKNIAKKSAELLTKYQNAGINIAGRRITLPQITTVVSSIGAGIFFAKGIKSSIEGQLGITRKASFDGTQKITNNHKMFAILTTEQEKELEKITKHNEKHQTAFVDKLKDKLDVTSSFQAVEEYNRTKKDYLQRKEEYFNKEDKFPDKKLSTTKLKQAEDDKQLFQNLLKNMEHDVLNPLQKVETMANIGYSALFAGGFLEYLITDKLVDVLHIQNKPLRGAMKIGVPILTYLLLNKNISDFENKAILATKYKHLKQFIDNPEQYHHKRDDKNQNIIDFIKTVAKDMKDYDTFAEKELPKIKEKLESKQQIRLTPEQEKQAKLLQKQTNLVVNTQRERMLEQTVGIEALSETVTNPIDILGAAVGGAIGNALGKKCNAKYAGFMTALGTIVGFIPIAVMEAKFTAEQKKAERIASMLAMKDLDTPQKFADYSNSEYENIQAPKNHAKVFNGIATKFV